MSDLPKELLERCRAVMAKRPKTVIDHILAHGFITTEELKDQYGYNHPPRAVRDVREHGIPLETFRVTGADGRKIAAYRFGDWQSVSVRKLAGRTGLSKKLKDALIARYGCQCFIYREVMDERDLQIDHRVPYEVDGDGQALDTEDFMLLSASANRAKSWSCEHCENWNSSKDRQVCLSCYWAFPEHYTHVAGRPIRRIDLVWQGDEVAVYEKLQAAARELGKEVPEFVKEVLARELGRQE